MSVVKDKPYLWRVEFENGLRGWAKLWGHDRSHAWKTTHMDGETGKSYKAMSMLVGKSEQGRYEALSYLVHRLLDLEPSVTVVVPKRVYVDDAVGVSVKEGFVERSFAAALAEHVRLERNGRNGGRNYVDFALSEDEGLLVEEGQDEWVNVTRDHRGALLDGVREPTVYDLDVSDVLLFDGIVQNRDRAYKPWVYRSENWVQRPQALGRVRFRRITP
jgi:hypothetical protein